MTSDQSPHAGAADLRLLLALCPLLAASDTVVNALALGLAVIVTMMLAGALTAAIGRWLDPVIRWAAVLLIVAGVVAAVERVMDGWLHDVATSLGIFLPLTVANLIVVTRAEAARTAHAIGQAAKTACGTAAALLVLGIARELIGRGSLFHLSGQEAWTRALETNVFRVDMGFLLAMLPPGAFIAVGLLVAARNWIAQRRA